MIEWVFKPEHLSQGGKWQRDAQDFLRYVDRRCKTYQLTLGVFAHNNEFQVVGHFLWQKMEFHKIIVAASIADGLSQLFSELSYFIQFRKERKGSSNGALPWNESE